MIKFSSRSVVVAAMVFVTVLGACSSRLNETAGIEGTGDKVASRGVVTKLGSIYVNGIHFDTDMAEIYVDGELTTEETQLQGMVVTVQGTSGESETEAYALKVEAEYLVKGPIRSILVDENNLLYLELPAYSVIVPETTVFGGTDYDSLSIGDIVGVSGLEVDDDTIYASQIIALEGTEPAKIRGVISNANLYQKTFTINDVNVDYTNSSLTEIEDTLIVNGNRVSVSGQLQTESNTLIAVNISEVHRFEYADRLSVTEEGFAYNVSGDGTFSLNNLTVNTQDAEFKGGNREDLGERARVSVGGTIDSGVLVAEYVQIILPSTMRTIGHVESVDKFRWQFTIGDITFYTDPFTVFDDSSNSFKHFDLFDLREEDQVEVYARRTEHGWKAITVRRISGAPRPFTIQGRITQITVEGNFYLEDLYVSVENVPLNERWPYLPGQSVFVMGTIAEDGTLVAEHVTPSQFGCTKPYADDCRPPPDFLDDTYKWWPLPPPPSGDVDPAREKQR